jgi:uncharacterized protein
MLIGFDPPKSEKNERERGFGFLFAARIFLGGVWERIDRRWDYGEERIEAFGHIDGSAYVVVYAMRQTDDGTLYRWIISARRANSRERKRYDDQVPHNGGSGGGQAH